MSKLKASKRAKKRRQQKRQAIARAIKNDDFIPVFEGGMKIPLNAESNQEIEARTKFDGHWLTNRFKIMDKPRKYKIEIVLADGKGGEDRTEVRVTNRINKTELWLLIMKMGKENLEANKGRFISASDSFATVKA